MFIARSCPEIHDNIKSGRTPRLPTKVKTCQGQTGTYVNLINLIKRHELAFLLCVWVKEKILGRVILKSRWKEKIRENNGDVIVVVL